MQIDLGYIGPFQSGLRISTENALEEIWSRLALYGSPDYINENLTVNGTKAPPKFANSYV